MDSMVRFAVVEEQPRWAAVVAHVDGRRVGFQVSQPVGRQVEVVHEGHGPHQGVVAAADVEAGVQVADCRGAAPYLFTGLHQQGVHSGPGQVGRADEAVVAAAHHHGVGVANRSGAAGPGADLWGDTGGGHGGGAVGSPSGRTTTDWVWR